MKTNILRTVLVLCLLVSLIPVGAVGASTVAPPPPADFFQLPWDYGLAWYAIDGIDDTTRRPLNSSHHYSVGGAIDFAPRKFMVKGEDTSNFWVASAAGGTVVGISKCHVILDHGNGWVTQYQFLAKVQVQLGDTVARNQRLGIIADGVRYPFCPPSLEPDIPHLHFMLRPTIIGATFAGWEVRYNSFFNSTTFKKNGSTVGLYKPLLNTFDSFTTPLPTYTPTPTASAPTTPPSTSTTPTDSTPPPTSTAPTAITPIPSPTSTTPTPTGPYVSTTTNQPSINIGETALVAVSLNNVTPASFSSAEFICVYDPNMLEVNNIIIATLFGVDSVIALNGPQNGSFILAVAGSRGNKAATSGAVFTFNAKGLQAGQINLNCTGRVNTGNNILTDLPSIGTTLTIIGIAPMPTSTPAPETPFPTLTPTTPNGDWLTFTNFTNQFLFQYPPTAQIVSGGNDNFTRINLPFTQGTNLSEKYFEMVVTQNAIPCQSPLATQSMLEKSESVTLNGITFLKQTGGDAGAGNIYQWVAYSTARENTCVSLDFILHSHNPGNYPVPPPVFDHVAESAVFDQMASTYTWLAFLPTATPTPLPYATLNGYVFASKPVTIYLNNLDGSNAGSVSTNPDGSFTLSPPSGTYITVASSSGFLNAQASVVLTDGMTVTLPSITLPAGDIDGNNVIDQFDALTIGMNYNASQPSIADLNNDGIVNVLDLESLARNYRMTGPIVWQ